MNTLPADDQPPTPRGTPLSPGDHLYFAVIGGIGVLCLIAQALVFAGGYTNLGLGMIGALFTGIWAYAIGADATDRHTNTRTPTRPEGPPGWRTP